MAPPDSTYGRLYQIVSPDMPKLKKLEDRIARVGSDDTSALITDMTIVDYNVAKDCTKFYKLPDVIFVAGHGWVLQKGSHLKHIFDLQ